MPIYEYVCSKCGSKFELLRRLSQASEDAPCPECQSTAKRIMSTFAACSRSSDGFSTPISGSSSCASCSATSCNTCDI